MLRVLEDHQVQRLGGRTQRKIDLRLICATNEPLEEMARTGRFREDLYYRIQLAQSYAAQEKILLPEGGASFDEEVERLELALLTTALRRSQGGQAAARLLRLDIQRMKYLCR